jgi:catechol 2,3-dioxygenase-like lactoylglutathione lyase family enzyme
MQVLFVAGFGPIVQDLSASKKLYQDVLGLPLEGDDYLNTNQVEGVKEFALWPLSQAAESCFGSADWPRDLPVPQAWLEFDVEDIESATKELEAQGYKLLVTARKEPWGQTITRLLSPEGDTAWYRSYTLASGRGRAALVCSEPVIALIDMRNRESCITCINWREA